MAQIGELFLAFNTDASGIKNTLDNAAPSMGQGFGDLFSQGFAMGFGMQVFNKLAEAAGKVWDYFTDGAQEAYRIQFEAEKRIETVMRQRMKSTEAEIQQIKDLASEIQNAGIIGDEVTLTGAQQLATFLNDEGSLKTLLPAMDNLLAQQKGLKASTGDAITVGNLMGKVMQGQTSALTRVGITFTEAQEQVLKYGNEQERAAMLAQVIVDNVGEMNAALAGTDLGRQQQLDNVMGDIKEKFGLVYTNLKSLFIPILQKFADLVDGIANKLIDLTEQLKDFASEMGWITFASAETNAKTAADNISDVFTSAADEANEAIQGIGLASFDTLITLGKGAETSDATDESEVSETAKAESKEIADDAEEKTNIFKKAWEKVSPVFEKVYETAEPYIERTKGVIEETKGVVDEWWNTNGGEFSESLQTVWGYVKDIGGYVLDKIITALERWFPGFVEGLLNFTKGLIEFIEKWWPYIEPIVKILIDILFVIIDIVAFCINAILNEFWPTVNAIIDGIAMALLIMGEVIWAAWNLLLDFILTIVNAIWTAFSAICEFIYALIETIWEAISGAGEAIGGFFSGLWDTIVDFCTGIGDKMKDFWSSFIDWAKAPLNGIIGFVNKIINGINSVKLKAPDWLGGMEIGFNIPNIPQLADGGIAKAKNGGQLVNVAEAGQDEAIIPLNQFWAHLDNIAGLINTIIQNQVAIAATATAMPEIKAANIQTDRGNSEIDEKTIDRIVSKLATAIDPTLTIESLEVRLGTDAVVDKVINSINRKTKLKGRSVIINT